MGSYRQADGQPQLPFLARHDYFRRVLCNRVAEELMDGTFLSEKAALKLLTDLCVENSRKLFGE